MRRFFRIVRSLAIVLSILLIVGISIAFVGSDFEGDAPWHWGEFNASNPRYTNLTISKGGLDCGRYLKTVGIPASERREDWKFFGFELDNTGFLESGPPAPPSTWIYYAGWRLQIPFAPIFLFSLILPVRALWLAVRKSRRSRAVGLCAVCGYDLRATPQRCPECGTVPGESTQIAS